MSRMEPFSRENLNKIFKISPTHTNRIISRESKSLEFKESFGWRSLSKYLKTAAAFANTKGGYIVFGIADSPHKLIGLAGKRLAEFRDIDPEKLTGHFNEHFSPEIIWEVGEHELEGKFYGLIYVHKSDDRPVICTKVVGKDLKEGDIYYRYRGRSQRIKYTELKRMLEKNREREQALWMQHVSQIARIGVQEAGIFDLKTGIVRGKTGSFLIDESLLSQLSFIKEGEFSEVKGKPTLKLVGNVEMVGKLPTPVGRGKVIKTQGIRIGDIVTAFLNHERVLDPKEYIKQICFEATAFLPVYYFINMSGASCQVILDELEAVISRSQAKKRLIERLRVGEDQVMTNPTGDTKAAKKKRTYLHMANTKKLPEDLEEQELIYCLQAIRTMKKDDVKRNSKYLRQRLKQWFNKYYMSRDGRTADNLRRTICWIDEALYMKMSKSD